MSAQCVCLSAPPGTVRTVTSFWSWTRTRGTWTASATLRSPPYEQEQPDAGDAGDRDHRPPRALSLARQRVEVVGGRVIGEHVGRRVAVERRQPRRGLPVGG